MTTTLRASGLNLHDIESQFGLQYADDEQFFREWIDDLSELTDGEKQALDKLKAGYLNNAKYSMLEDTVKMVVLGPLLYLADFYQAPFHIEAEKSVELVTEDEGIIVRGNIDVLLLRENLWVVAIETKSKQYSIEAGLPQLLFYMLSNPVAEVPTFGLLTNGSNFRFVKVLKGETWRYAVSKMFDTRNPGNDLYDIFRILKRLAYLVSNNGASLAVSELKDLEADN
ncbi:MAG: restriction endonuclease subunit R [Cyanobacteriota bacterium]|nr:restriction endonuclease subunit R [Cyanobacteriota bacterium]